jgi:peptidoglycan DL-endopeptidase CwlO
MSVSARRVALLFLSVGLLLSAGLLQPAGVAVADPAGGPSVAELDRRIAAASRQFETVVEQYNDAGVALRETTVRRSSLDRTLAPLEADLDQRHQVLGGLAAELYRHTLHGPDVTLLSTRSPQDFVDQLLTLHRIDTEQRRALDSFAAARSRVETARRDLTALAAEQNRQRARLAATKRAIAKQIAGLRILRARAYGDGYRLPDTDVPPPPYAPGPAGRAVAFVYAQLGKPYRWGADGPDAYDCSGLTSSAWARAGVHLAHNARRQFHETAHVGRDDLRPGDLVFYFSGISHVGMYIGGGKIIHAPEYGERVRVEDVDFAPIQGYGRPA